MEGKREERGSRGRARVTGGPSRTLPERRRWFGRRRLQNWGVATLGRSCLRVSGRRCPPASREPGVGRKGSVHPSEMVVEVGRQVVQQRDERVGGTACGGGRRGVSRQWGDFMSREAFQREGAPAESPRGWGLRKRPLLGLQVPPSCALREGQNEGTLKGGSGQVVGQIQATGWSRQCGLGGGICKGAPVPPAPGGGREVRDRRGPAALAAVLTGACADAVEAAGDAVSRKECGAQALAWGRGPRPASVECGGDSGC